MAPHSSTLAWKIPWMEEPGRPQSMGLLTVGHDWATSLSLLTLSIGEGNGNPLQCSCLENPRDGGAWWAAVYGVAQSRTRLKWLSSGSVHIICENACLCCPVLCLCALVGEGEDAGLLAEKNPSSLLTIIQGNYSHLMKGHVPLVGTCLEM